MIFSREHEHFLTLIKRLYNTELIDLKYIFDKLCAKAQYLWNLHIVLKILFKIRLQIEAFHNGMQTLPSYIKVALSLGVK